MNRIERLTGILLLLQERPRTSSEIAQHFEVSKRTVFRDIQALCEIGVPIITRDGLGGGYSLPNDYFLGPLPLTFHEAFLLLLALRTIAQLTDVPFAPADASLVAKVRALMPRRQLADAEKLLAAVAIEFPRRHQRAAVLEPLIAAAVQQCWVEATYQSADRRSTQHLLPRKLYSEGGLWYCRAYAHEHAEERTYRVDRFVGVAPASTTFQPSQPPDPRPYGDESHPHIVARLSAYGVAEVERDRHLGDQVVRHDDGTGDLSFRCPPGELDWYAHFFAALGEEVEIFAPEELRERLHQLGQVLVDRYRKR
jgi:predicted DNA-binding transcriptional regulator YafY